MKNENIGKIIQIIGAVIDVRFEGEVPSLYNAIEVPFNEETVVLEVLQHLGNHTVRCISMHPTDGLTRGMEATNSQRSSGSFRTGYQPGDAGDRY